MRPGWSTSCIVAAKSAAVISRGVKTDCVIKKKIFSLKEVFLIDGLM